MAKVASQIDLEAKATWPITLGESITATKKAARLTSIRYNYQPRLDKSIAKREIRSAAGTKASGTIKEKEQIWNYAGTQDVSSDSYVLILKNDGSKEAVLERLDNIALNITSTPVEKDVSKLKDRYKQLFADEEQHMDEGHEDSTPDDDNPFDFRHFLENSPKPVEQAQSAAVTPSHRPTLLARPTAAAKRKPETSAPAPKRNKVEAAPKAKKPASRVPDIRLERKASMRPAANDEDNGELILEGDDDVPAPRSAGARHSAMSMALSGSLGGRPISLHSAASSPVGLHSPGSVRPAHAEDEEIDLGGDEYMEDADNDDGDIEEFDLPSPVQHSAKSAPIAIDDDDDDDDDDDFGRQLAEGLGQDDDGPVVHHIPEEEESEEE